MADPARPITAADPFLDNHLQSVIFALQQQKTPWTIDSLVRLWDETEEVETYIQTIQAAGTLAGNAEGIETITVRGETIRIEQLYNFFIQFKEAIFPILRSDNTLRFLFNLKNRYATLLRKKVQELENDDLYQDLKETAALAILLNEIITLIKRAKETTADSINGMLPQDTADTTTEEVLDSSSESQPTSTAVVKDVPKDTPLNTTDDVNTENLASTRRPFNLISMHNAFARNEVAFLLLQQYGYGLQEGNPFELLTPQVRYLIDQDLKSFLFSLSDEQVQQLNRHAFVQHFFEQFRQKYPYVMQAERGLSATALTKVVPAADAPAPPQELADQTVEADASYNQVQVLSRSGFFNQDAADIETALAESLARYGIPRHQVPSIEWFLNNIAAVGEDETIIFYGLNPQQIKDLFPVLTKLTDAEVAEVIEAMRLYVSLHRGLVTKITNRQAPSTLQGEEISAESAEILLSGQNISPGALANDSSLADRVRNVAVVSELGSTSNNEHTGTMAAIAMHSSADELHNPQSYVRQQMQARFAYPVFRDPQVVEGVQQGVVEYQTLLYGTSFELLGEQGLSDFERRLMLLTQTFQPADTTRLGGWKTRLSRQPGGARLLGGNRDQLIAQMTPNEIFDWIYDSDTQQNIPAAARLLDAVDRARSTHRAYNLLKTLRGAKEAGEAATQAATAAETVSKAKFLSQMMLRAGTAAKKVSTALNLGRILLAIKAAISAIIAAITAALGPLAGVALGLGGAALGGGLLSSLLGNASAAGGDLLSQGARSLTTNLAPPATAAEATAGAGGSGAAPFSGETLASKANNAAKNFLNPTTTTGLTAMTVGGTATVAVITASFTGAFFKPLDIKGEESPYVDIEKVAYLGEDRVNKIEQLSTPTDITYRITVKPKDGYTIQVSSLEDNWDVRFNEEKLDELNQAVPTIEPVTRLYKVEGDPKHPDFADDITLEEGKLVLTGDESLVLEYQTRLTPNMMHSSVDNSFSLGFEFSKGDETGNDSASIDFSICLGECPQVGKGCWPLDGKLSQLPFDQPKIVKGPGSHAPGKITQKGLDAFDIGVQLGTPVVAPYDGRVCGRPYDGGGYGTYLVMDRIGGENFELHFAHLSATMFGGDSSACRDVQAGEVIGYSGNSGNSTGPHLHYGLYPVATSMQSRLKEFVPPSKTLFESNDSGNSVNIGKLVSTFGPICRANGSSD